MRDPRQGPAMAAPAEGPAPASPKEEALWLLETFVPGTAANNLAVAFAVAGRLDPAQLEHALSRMVRRHEALRTVYYAANARLTKRVLDADQVQPDVVVTSMAGEPSEDDLTPFLAVPFPLDGRPLLRACVLRYPRADVVCVAAHQLVLDGPSRTVLLEELAAAYEGRDEPEPAPAYTEPPPGRESLGFWRRVLDGADTGALDLACGKAEPARPTLAGGRATRRLSDGAAAGVRALDVSEPAALLAAYCVLLEAHGAGPDLVVGVPVDVRPAEAARSIGYHVTVVPVRIAIDPGERVRDLVRRIEERRQAAVAHADVAVDAESATLLRTPSGRRAALFRHVFEYADAAQAGFELAGLAAERLTAVSGSSKSDVEFTVAPTADGFQVQAIHRTEILRREDAELLLDRYDAVLRSFGADPDGRVGDVRFWSARDHQVIDAANDTAAPAPAPSVLRAVQQRVRDAPDAVAIVDGDREVSYRSLWSAAHGVAERLRSAGLGPGDVVAVALPRGAGLAASVLGAWLAGAAYLPIDAAHPAERIAHQLTDSGAKVLLAGAEVERPAGAELRVLPPPPVPSVAHDVPDAEPVTVDPAACAYLMYTSGSTGRPKGTLIPHSALANLVAHFIGELGATSADTTLWTTTFAFDISGLELLVPLASGGRVVAAPDLARADGRVLRELLEGHEVRFVQATPTTWRLVIDRAEGALRGRSVLCGGEPVPVPLARRLVAAGCELHHVYGPTETTIWSTSAVVAGEPTSRLDVGRPIRNTRVLVLDGHGRALPIGVRGELCIAGDGVAIGYHDRPDLNAERFGVHPEYGRYYRTGDVASWSDRGVLDLLGRSDRQVKLRGNRIELGEIEATLLAHPQVGAAAVVMVGDPGADAVLVACLEPAGGEVDVEGVMALARDRLARSMLPADVLVVAPLPVNGSGKVDYPALERMAVQRREPRPAVHGGDGGLLEDLIGLWRSLLKRDDVGADTDFFEHGGHSMLAALAMQELERLSGVSLGLSEMFEEPTPWGLAARVREAQAAQSG
ncbi:non-ribosomal peptide synthetase [Actinomadura violacea]|uniref:Amino acid adenylation domain-containing protein n=1 Tax=Actinomadura violacea TaxID=2819934 RepID=A0ABS3RJL4_9ACTN|nr:non-ribosomal peptide synthetase [Actinomadura violacea]MBO2456927.1 amino acid adenylation domain-containing protein [Actinomadura violacea]